MAKNIGVFARGADYQIDFTLRSDGVAVDITGATVTAEAESDVFGADHAMTLQDASNGVARLAIADTDWVATASADDYKGDVKVVFSDATIRYWDFELTLRVPED